MVSSPGSSSPLPCPDLDFTDCISTPPSFSPEAPRLRGAPWASRRPKPYSDGLKQSEVPLQCNEPFSRHSADQVFPDYHSRSKANYTQLQSPDLVREEKDLDLTKTLFPETITKHAGTILAESHTKVFIDDSSIKALNRKKARQRSWKGHGAQHGDEICSSSSLPLALPVTPRRNSQASADQQITNATGTNAPASFPPLLASVGYTYSRRRKNESILRSARIRQFAGITGTSTASRTQAPALQSEKEPNSTRSDVDVGGTSTTSSSLLRPASPRGSLDGNLENHCVDCTQTLQNYSPRPSRHAGNDTVLDTASSTRKRVRPLSLASSTQNANEAVSSDGKLRVVKLAEDSYNGTWKRRHQFESHKDWVYERVLSYPHSRSGEESRPGHKALQMGYLIPTPHDDGHLSSTDYESEPERKKARRKDMMILGRLSQTDFRISNLQNRFTGKIRSGSSRTNQSSVKQACDNDLEQDSDTSSDETRRKPLSRLKGPALFNILGDSVQAQDPGILQGRNRQTLLSKRAKTGVKLRVKPRKESAKIAIAVAGRRPLDLHYANRQPASIPTRPSYASAIRQPGHRGVDSVPAIREPTADSFPKPANSPPLASNLRILALSSQSQASHTSILIPATPSPPATGECIREHSEAEALYLVKATGPVVNQALDDPFVTAAALEPISTPAQDESRIDRTRCRSALLHSQTKEPSAGSDTRTGASDAIDGHVLERSGHEENLSSFPSGCWYGLSLHEDEELCYPSYIEGIEYQRNLSGDRAALETSALRASVPSQRVGCIGTWDNSLIRWSSIRPAKTSDRTSPQQSEVSSTDGGSGMEDHLFNDFADDETPPYSIGAILNEIASGVSLPVAHPGQHNLPSPAATRPACNDHGATEEGPAPHQPCYAPYSYSYWSSREEVTMSVPSDVERQYHQDLEHIQNFNLEGGPPDIASLPSAQGTPQVNLPETNITLQDKLDAYGRRVFGMQAMYRRPPRKPMEQRTIPQSASIAS